MQHYVMNAAFNYCSEITSLVLCCNMLCRSKSILVTKLIYQVRQQRTGGCARTATLSSLVQVQPRQGAADPDEWEVQGEGGEPAHHRGNAVRISERRAAGVPLWHLQDRSRSICWGSWSSGNHGLISGCPRCDLVMRMEPRWCSIRARIAVQWTSWSGALDWVSTKMLECRIRARLVLSKTMDPRRPGCTWRRWSCVVCDYASVGDNELIRMYRSSGDLIDKLQRTVLVYMCRQTRFTGHTKF